MSDRWDRVTALFDAARALDAPLRGRFLDLACAEDRDLRADVELLLASDRDDGFLARTPWTAIGEAIDASSAADGAAATRVPLGAGTRLGPYEIEIAIGAGGMGDVYRARDTTLNRHVALKLLPEAFVRDPDRLGRFQREAQLLASLNHPNIAHIYGFEQGEAGPFLVLELVDGALLSDRIAAAPLPLADALAVAVQIADALAAAHERGIVHRDLKPANIKVRDDGTVKVLDFGLAKALDPAPALSAIESPAPGRGVTQIGFILGTAAYMAPERARGRPGDHRADIWAFGVVLFEMLTGRQLFAGDSGSEVMASVMRDEPDWTRLPPDLPDATRRLLRRCLEKDPRQRLSAIADARHELTDSLGPRAKTTAARSWPLRGVLSGALAAAALVAIAWLALSAARRPSSDVRLARVSVLGPANATLLLDPSESAISPDGRSLVFTTVDPRGETLLWVRPLDTLEAHPLAGTDRATLPFWSPDSQQIAFFAGEHLKRIPAAGGTAVVLCAAKDARGGTWGAQGTIVFAPGNGGPLESVPASGGEPRAATTLDDGRGETAHRFPSFLPDGRHFVYVALPPHNQEYDLFVGSLDGSSRNALTSAAGAAVYAAPGYLIFPRRNTIVAQRFDASRLTLLDEPIVIGEAPAALGALYNASRAVTVSTTGALLYLNDRLPNTRFEWLDRSGRALGPLAVPDGRYKEFTFAPDGRRAALVRYTSAAESDVWIVDLDRGGATRLTYGPAGNVSSAWSPDGARILFDSDRNGPRDLFVTAARGSSAEEPLFASTMPFKYSQSWSADGKWITFDQLDPRTNRDLWILPAEGPHTPRLYLRTPFSEGWGQVSPDGRSMAYLSDESGRQEAYVDAFPTPSHKRRLTDGGAGAAVWRKDGKELAIVSLDNRSLLVADVTAGADFHVGTPRPLVSLPRGTAYALPTPDFQRVLVARPIEERTASSFTLVLDWAGALAKR